MSYRELRNFCEMMRALGYPRLISMENFRKPNFELVADILYWLAKRYDPQSEIPDDIDEEKHRVEFIKSITLLFTSKARIKLNPKKLYQSDGYAVQELLKIATMLYKAYNASGHEDDDTATDFSLPTKLSNLKAIKAVAQEITDTGAKLHDLLDKEPELKQHREKAMQFLDNISSNLASTTEQAYIEKNIREIIKQQSENIVEMQKYVTNLEKDERTLEEKIKRQSVELERAEKRLKSLSNVRPAFMDEYERLEQELEKLYTKYMEKLRNLDYLEHQLDLYNLAEEEKLAESRKYLEKIGISLKAQEMRQLRGEEEVNENILEEQIQREENSKSRAQSRGGNKTNIASSGFNKSGGDAFKKASSKPDVDQRKQPQFSGNLNGPDEDDDEEEIPGMHSGDEEGSLIDNLDDQDEDEEEGSDDGHHNQSDHEF